jgi:intein/homing endonuclease
MNSRGADLERTDLAYLAGIIDGEGSLSVRAEQKNGGRLDIALKPYLDIVNTNMRLIQRVHTILAQAGVDCRIYTHSPAAGGRLTAYRVRMDSAHKIMKILPLVIPYLTAKRRRAELVYAFLSRRARRLSQGGGPNGARYTLQEARLAEQISNEIAASTGKIRSRNPRLQKAMRQLATHA